MDILQLIDRLEELLDQGTRLPLSNKVAIEEEAFLNIVDQMRIMIPQEIKLAREVQREKDKYIAQANEEARRIIAQAREDAAKALDEHELRLQAQQQAEQILQNAHEEAARIRLGADDWAETKLRELAKIVGQLEDTIRNGLRAIESDRAAAQELLVEQEETPPSSEEERQEAVSPAPSDPSSASSPEGSAE